MDAWSVVWMAVHWVSSKVEKTDANWAVVLVGVMGTPTVAHWVEQLADEKDVKSAVSSVDSKVAM